MTVQAPDSVTVHRTQVDGVPVMWTDLAVDPTVTLFFGVGHKDMAPWTVGITHLVEHLVMRRVGHVSIPNNAESGMVTTNFYATGTPARLADFVRRVCDAVTWLREVTDDDLELERRTILAEVGMSSVYASHGDPFAARYGLAGVGLGAVSHTRLLDWAAEEVRAVAAQWFHAGNALLSSTAPLPEGLVLPLPAGPAPRRTLHPAPLWPGRTWQVGRDQALLLSGSVDGDLDRSLSALAMSVLDDVLHHELRTALGQVYSVDGVGYQVDPYSSVVASALDPERSVAADATRATLRVIERLALEGPTVDELDRTRGTLLESLALGAGRAGWFDSIASWSVRGIDVPTFDQETATIRDARPEDLRPALAAYARSLLVSIPCTLAGDTDLIDHLTSQWGAQYADLTADPQGRTGKDFSKALLNDAGGSGPLRLLKASDRMFSGKRFSAARGVDVWLLPDRLVVAGGGQVDTVVLDDIVLVGTDEDGDVELVTQRGAAMLLNPSLFKGLRDPFAAMVRHLPRAVVYDKQRVKVRPVDGAAPD
ncbi:hypothetical protein [Cellulomonas sp.]|uniref:M16 family metallopeptidase n=1 Tax=Cellulomonas sp. TaxID=40001 RepID=UPI001B08E16C|nr:hypothetical protein [Cellulomonas sp.]MBO9553736.1 insulinase family protein [Cellulomonas sp.]